MSGVLGLVHVIGTYVRCAEVGTCVRCAGVGARDAAVLLCWLS